MLWREELEEVKAIVTREILRAIEENVRPEGLAKASAHLIKGGGKRLRPYLVVEVGRSLGANLDRLLPGAMAVEFIHNFSLIHDDIMDNDQFRRGIRTVHTLWGVPTGILAGDVLYALAFTSLGKLREVGVRASRVQMAYEELSKAVLRLAVGQGLDMTFPKMRKVRISSYIEMIGLKTGALFECSAKLGAIIADGKRRTISKMGVFGRYIGIAFQIIDDILGIFGDERVTGKPVGSDIREGKKTILVLYTLKKAEKSEKKLLLRTLGKRDARRSEISKAISVIERSGAKEYAMGVARKYALKAVAALDALPDGPHKEHLKGLAEFIIEREF